MVKKRRKHKKPEATTKMWTELAIVALLLVAVIAGSLYYSGQVGQAVHIGPEPLLEPANLTAEESFIFTYLPEEEVEVVFQTVLAPYGDETEYKFVMSPNEDQTFSFDVILKEEEGEFVIAKDILRAGEVTKIYLDETNAVPDLEVSFLNNRIEVKNLHYITADTSSVILMNESGTPYPAIIRLNASTAEEPVEFTAIINASSAAAPPELSVSVGELTDIEQNFEENYTIATFTLTAPEEDAALLLDITADVSGKRTHTYHTFAVGDMIYALKEIGYPELELKLTEGDQAELSITFKADTDMQPFAVPCEIPLVPGGVQTSVLFGRTNVGRIYSFSADGGLPLLWDHAAATVADFGAIYEEQGYFIKLKEEQVTQINTTCTVQSFAPIEVPGLGDQETFAFDTGWTLFSMSGIVPRPLTDFTDTENFVVFECRQGYNCQQIETGAPLNPGKPYWIYTGQRFTIQYKSGNLE